MKTTWEKAKPENAPIVAYHCYLSTLPVFKPPVKPSSKGFVTLQTAFELSEGNVSEGAIEDGKHVDYKIRLPYTLDMLRRRYDAGQSMPDFISMHKTKPAPKSRKKKTA